MTNVWGERPPRRDRMERIAYYHSGFGGRSKLYIRTLRGPPNRVYPTYNRLNGSRPLLWASES